MQVIPVPIARFIANGKARFACAATGVAAAAGIATFAFCLSATNSAQAPGLARRAAAPWAAWHFDSPRGEKGKSAAAKPLPEADLALRLVSCTVDYRPGGRVMQGPPMRAVVCAAPEKNPFAAAPLAEGRWPGAASSGKEIVCSKAMFSRFEKFGLPPLGSELKFVGSAGTVTATIAGYLDGSKVPPGFPTVFANPAAFDAFAKERHGTLSLWREIPADPPDGMLTPESETVSAGFKDDDMRRMDYARPLMIAAALMTALCLTVNSLLLSVEANRRELALLRVAGMTRTGAAAATAAEAFLIGMAGCAAGCAAAVVALFAWTAANPAAFPAGATVPARTVALVWAGAAAVSALAAALACGSAMSVRPLEAAGGRPSRRRRGMAVAFACGYAAFVAAETWGASLMRAFVPSPELPDAIVSLLPGGTSSFDIEKIRAVPGVARATELYPLQVPLDPPEKMEARGGGRGPGGGRPQYRNILVLGSEWLPELRMVEGTHAGCAAALSNSMSCVIAEMVSRAWNIHAGDELPLCVMSRDGSRESVKLKIAGVADVNWHMVTSRGLLRGLDGAPAMTDGPAFVSLQTAEAIDPRPPFAVKMTHAWIDCDKELLESKGVFSAGRQIEDGIAKALGDSGAYTVRLHARDEIADGTLAHGSDLIGKVARIPAFFLAVLSIGFIAMTVAEADASRRELHALRAAGATRWQLAMRLVRTAAAVAAKGMAAGLPAGAAIGWYAARRTGATWPGLPPYFEIPWRAVAEGTLAALAAVFAVAVPAAMRIVKPRRRTRPAAARALAMSAAIAAAIAAAAPAAHAARPYDCPALQERHIALRSALVRTLGAKDWPRMESTCRAGVKLDKTDPFWRYNLACALARLGRKDESLAELSKAVDLGFRDSGAITSDDDLSALRDSPRFKQIADRAGDASLPVPDTHPVASAKATIAPGKKTELSEKNLTWNFDAGVFMADAAAAAPPPGAAAAEAASYSGPAAASVRKWLAEGTAAGNAGDTYMNRDHGHSMLQTKKFPLLAQAVLDAEGRKRGIDTNEPKGVFPLPLFANCSRAYVGGVSWRSIGRRLASVQRLATRMALLYRANQVHVFPANKDFGAGGDLMHCATPCFFMTRGASWSDTPLLELLLSASASFRPETKREIVRRGLLVPTLQALLRRTLAKGGDPRSPEANPTVFQTGAVDASMLAGLAHGMGPEEIPPAVSAWFVEKRDTPPPAPGRDYPDVMPEPFVVTPYSSCFVLRAPAAVRRFSLFARPDGTAPGEDAELSWRVTKGDPSAVKLAEEPGSRGRRATVEIDVRKLRSRVDIACFARTAKSGWGAPSFVSFMPAPGESRTYGEDGRILSIDYRNIGKAYCDPEIALPKNWRDTYLYADDGRLQAVARFRDGESEPAMFTPDGMAAYGMDGDFRPESVAKVRYLVRSTGDAAMPQEIVWAEDAPEPAGRPGAGGNDGKDAQKR